MDTFYTYTKHTVMKRKEKHGKAENDRRVAETLNMCEFEANVYRASYRTTRITWTLCQKTKQNGRKGRRGIVKQVTVSTVQHDRKKIAER